MNPGNDKVMDLKDAIDRYVWDTCHISIGGFTVNRNPMAAVYEIIRQKKKDLHLYAHSNGQGVDELIGGAACQSWKSPMAAMAVLRRPASDFEKPRNAKRFLLKTTQTTR